MNGDGLVNLDDVPAFVLALVDRPAYDLAYPLVNEESAGDVSLNGVFDLVDTGVISGLFGGPASANSVPEPTTLSLAVILLMGIAIR